MGGRSDDEGGRRMNDDWRFLGMYGMVTDASTSRVTVEGQGLQRVDYGC